MVIKMNPNEVNIKFVMYWPWQKLNHGLNVTLQIDNERRSSRMNITSEIKASGAAQTGHKTARERNP